MDKCLEDAKRCFLELRSKNTFDMSVEEQRQEKQLWLHLRQEMGVEVYQKWINKEWSYK